MRQLTKKPIYFVENLFAIIFSITFKKIDLQLHFDLGTRANIFQSGGSFVMRIKSRTGIACSIILFSLVNCSGMKERVAQIERRASANACIKVGYAVEHPQHEECIANTTAARVAQQRQEAQQSILDGLLLGTALNAAQMGGGVAPAAQPDASGGGSQGAVQMCPDGSYIYGTTCHLAPNGQYLSGPAMLAPNGQYVSGRPQMAPDGTYVGGSGPVRMCPDGTYVAGTRCIMTPNGTYVGGS